MLDPSNEHELVARLRANDELAFELLVRNYSSKVYAIARRFFSSDDDAQECLQKTFIQVFKNISSFKKNSSLMTWLHRIAVNEALIIIRQKKRHTNLPLEEFTQHYNKYGERTVFSGNLNESLENNIEKIFEKNETKSSLKRLIYQLPDKYCNVILLRDIQEMSTRETAELLGISEASIKTQLHRARLLLKAILEQQDKDNFECNWLVN